VAETAWYTYDDFADHTGGQFLARVPDGDGTSVPLILSDVSLLAEPGGTGPDGAARQQFSLLFRGPADVQLSQGLWELEHDAMGTFGLFLVALGPDAEGPRYEAVFA
jgi:hypothetical protein